MDEILIDIIKNFILENSAVIETNYTTTGKLFTQTQFNEIVAGVKQKLEPIITTVINNIIQVAEENIVIPDGSTIAALDGSTIAALDGSTIEALDGSTIEALDGSTIAALI